MGPSIFSPGLPPAFPCESRDPGRQAPAFAALDSRLRGKERGKLESNFTVIPDALQHDSVAVLIRDLSPFVVSDLVSATHR